LTAVKLSAILPLPVSVARHPEVVFTPVEGEPVLVRIVRALTVEVGEVLVPIEDGLSERVRAGLAGLPARVIAAGENRGTADCLAAALPYVQASASTHVLVADHRHPVLSKDLVARVIAALADGAELVVPVLPVTDTVKRVDVQGVIQSTVDRSELKITQYPYGAAVARLGDLPTVLGAGTDLVCVAGDADAVAFDLPADAALLAAVLTCRR
jgi:2-C-methyl-D-erythritol 4-phosphate cytidylyltransferase